MEGGTDKGKGKEQGKAKGKDNAKSGGKNSKGWKGWKNTADDAESVYTSGTAHGKNWGFAKEQERREQEQYKNLWSWYPTEHKWVRSNPRRERNIREDGPQSSTSLMAEQGSCVRPVKDETSLVNFGKYHDWKYGDILKENPHYVSNICNGRMESGAGKQEFQERITLRKYEMEKQAGEGQKR